MSQHDYVISNDIGSAVRADINNALGAIATINSGATEPSTTYAYQLWMDTSSNVLKIRNSANSAWYTLPISPIANNTVDINGGTIDGVTIGGSSAGAGTFTNLTATGNTTTADVTSTKSAAAVSTLNRTTSDGDIQVFQKDGTTVGSIGTAYSTIYIGDEDTGLLLNGPSDNILPVNPSTGLLRDNAIDFGSTSNRFKNLYLSGGVYLGGTGAANYLDDYEEGGYTVTLTPQTSGTIPLRSSVNVLGYTKIGNLVHVQGRLQTSNPLGSPVGSYMTVELPFAVADLNEYSEEGTFTWLLYDLSASTWSSPLTGRFSTSNSFAYLYGIDLATQLGTDDYIYITLSYTAA